MKNVFYDAATHVENAAITEWKAGGRPVTGYTCSYVPAEIFHAANILPVRLRGVETESMSIGDAYFGPYICSFPKCILQLAGAKKFHFLDGAVITPGCDSMRRLDECWRKAGEDHAGIVPPFFYYFDVPHKTAVHGMEWFKTEIRQLIKAVEHHFNVVIDDDHLREAVRVYNDGRRLLSRLETLRAEYPEQITGTDAFAVAVAATVMPRELYNTHLEAFIESLEMQSTPAIPQKKRLMLIGSICDDIELLQLIESGDNAVVVAENLCFGATRECHEIDASGDPAAALAQGYLGGSLCPRMYGEYPRRLAALKDAIARTRVEGVVMQNIRFCDLHGSENSLFERDLEADGIPCLKIEREYGPLQETGRIRMRLDAFLERL